MTSDPMELERRIERLRRDAGAVKFEPGFAERVMSRVARPRPLAEGLQSMFLRLAPLAAAAALILGAINLVRSRSSEQSLVDRLLGLPAVTLATAYTLDEGSGFGGGVPQ